ncbi:MAG: type II secretion system GspH family protein [Butyrivibrio sp.]|nr:type II secretion system GspH family protein [Butyrivibrio sp.]
MINKFKRNEKGFTLIELIVVLVILAVLMAVLIPVLLGWIDKAKDSQDRVMAENYRKAAQSVLTELYSEELQPNIEHRGYTDNSKSFSWYNDYRFTRFGEYVSEDLRTSGPSTLMIRVGHYPTYKDSDIHKAYTCYGIVYQRTSTSKPVILEGDQFYDYYPYPGGDYSKSVDGSTVITTYSIRCDGSPQNSYNIVKNALSN